MKNIVKLYEAYYPGKLIGRKVLTAEQARVIGVCSGIIIDLDAKETSILVSGRSHLIRISIQKIVSIENDSIVVDVGIPIEHPSKEVIMEELNDLREEMRLVSSLIIKMTLSNGRRDRVTTKSIDISKILFA